MKIEDISGYKVLTLEMDHLDAVNTNEFTEKITPHIQEGAKVILDLSVLTFIDSSGLGALLNTLRELRSKGGDLKICNVQQAVMVLFKMVRLENLVSIFPSREAALK